jgi:hypothetical protein
VQLRLLSGDLRPAQRRNPVPGAIHDELVELEHAGGMFLQELGHPVDVGAFPQVDPLPAPGRRGREQKRRPQDGGCDQGAIGRMLLGAHQRVVRRAGRGMAISIARVKREEWNAKTGG